MKTSFRCSSWRDFRGVYLKGLLAATLTLTAIFWQLPAAARVGVMQSDHAEFFEKQVRPLLATKCQMCHNAEAKTAGLDLSSAEGFAHGGASGLLLDSAQPAASLLLQVISYEGALKMPPMGKLKAEEIAVLTAWVKMGAPWPGTVPVAAEANKAPKNSSVREFTASEKAFWAFQPLQHPAVPRVKNTAWIKSPIDAFVLEKLKARKLAPAPPADKLTLLRRATYDLTGLPPTEAEIRAFLADNSPAAFSKVVERLLSSPRYGEKWGRHWLDVARYADSTGNDEDHRYPHAWKYRDYVIEAFNTDLPYDQFVREQLAGDLLPAPDGSQVNRRGIIATGFLALGPKAIAQQDKKKMLYDVYDEQVDVTSKAFMGLTMACARCHNHKFDPLLTRDYYSLVGMFASTRSFTNPDSHVSVVLEKPLVTRDVWAQYQAAKKAHQEKEKRTRLASEEILDSIKEPAAIEHAAQLARLMLAAHQVYQDSLPLAEAARQVGMAETTLQRWVDYLKPKDLTPQHLLAWRNVPPEKRAEVAQDYQQRFQQRLAEWQEKVDKWRVTYQQALRDNKELPGKPAFEAGEDRFFHETYFGKDGPFAVSDDDIRLTATQKAEIARLRQELEQLKKSAPKEPEMACAIEDGEIVAQKVLVRGDYNHLGEAAPKAFPAILSRYDTKPEFTGSGRLQFATWLTQPEHPLTSRVMVNRIWQWHFGEGLVRTPDNFGKMGESPTHPALLDYLAQQFIASGWSVKAMHRMLMLSSTYQMSSLCTAAAAAADPENRLLTRFNRRRLTVEEMRDGLLAITGRLDLTMGGTLQTGRGTDGENNQGRLSMNPEKLTRRTVYLPLRRANLPTLLNLFDFGDATSMQGKRQLTNVATQALFWLNSEFLTEQSLHFAKSLLAQEQISDAVRIESACVRILNRQANKTEVAQALAYIAGFQQKFPHDTAEKAWQSFCRVLMASNDFLYLD